MCAGYEKATASTDTATVQPASAMTESNNKTRSTDAERREQPAAGQSEPPEEGPAPEEPTTAEAVEQTREKRPSRFRCLLTPWKKEGHHKNHQDSDTTATSDRERSLTAAEKARAQPAWKKVFASPGRSGVHDDY